MRKCARGGHKPRPVRSCSSAVGESGGRPDDAGPVLLLRMVATACKADFWSDATAPGSRECQGRADASASQLFQASESPALSSAEKRRDADSAERRRGCHRPLFPADRCFPGPGRPSATKPTNLLLKRRQSRIRSRQAALSHAQSRRQCAGREERCCPSAAWPGSEQTQPLNITARLIRTCGRGRPSPAKSHALTPCPP